MLGARSLAGRGDHARSGHRQPAPGEPGKLPFWNGDAVGPAGRARPGARGVRRASSRPTSPAATRPDAATACARRTTSTSCAAEQPARLPRRASGRRPARCRPTGRRGRALPRRARRLAAVHPDAVRRPGPRAVGAGHRGRLRERLGIEVQTIWSDDGIAIRLPEGDDRDAPASRTLLFPTPTRSRTWSSAQVGDVGAVRAAGSARTPRGRCSCRAAGPGTRTPLWQQRQRAADLLAGGLALRQLPDPRRDVPRVPAGRLRPAGAARAAGGVARARDRGPSASRRRGRRRSRSSLLFDYVAAYMYEGDAPLAERRAAALALDRDLLRELLGQEELRELLDPEALADLELAPGASTDDRQATTPRASTTSCAGSATCRPTRSRPGSKAAPRSPRLAGRARRRAGAPSGSGSPATSAGSRSRTSPATATASGSRRRAGCRRRSSARRPAPLDGLLARWARTHGPFLTPEPARRWGLPVGVVEDALERLLGRRHGPARRVPARRRRARVVRSGGPAPAPPALAGAAAARGRAGRPGGARRASCPRWHGIARSARPAPFVARRPSSGSPRSSTSCRARRSPRRSWSATSCRRGSPATSRDCSTSSARSARSPGSGRGSLGRDDGRSRSSGRVARSSRPAGPPDGARAARPSPRHDAIREHLARRGASFYRELLRRRRRAATARCSTRCGISSGPARSPTTRSRRCGPALAADRRRRARRGRPATALRPLTAGSARREAGGPVVARRPPLLGRADRRPSGPRPGLRAARAPRRLTREAVAGRGRRGRLRRRSTRCSGRSKRPAGSGAATSSTGSAPPSSRCPARSSGCARCASRPRRRPRVHLLAAADPANPYGAALPWPRRGEADRRAFVGTTTTPYAFATPFSTSQKFASSSVLEDRNCGQQQLLVHRGVVCPNTVQIHPCDFIDDGREWFSLAERRSNQRAALVLRAICSLDPTRNFIKVEVSTGYDASATSIALTSGSGASLPQPSTDGGYNLVWFDATTYGDPADDPNKEIVRCTARSTDTLTVTRAQRYNCEHEEDTAGKTYKMVLSITKKMINDIIDRQIDNELVGTGNDVTTSFPLAFTPNPTSSLHVRMQGVEQHPTDDYSLSGGNVVFVVAPPSGAKIYADYRH